MKIYTKWGEALDREHPLPEYPRPQFERESYLNLNGVWNYLISKKKTALPEAYEGEIVVPFSPESVLSGVERVLQPDEYLYYEREFTVPEGFVRGRVLLNFGAVDHTAEVYVNDRFAGSHRGGYNPFSLDVTDFVSEGKNRIAVTVTDPTDEGVQCRGKQKLRHGGIWYTPQSGIWQTVWMESVPEVHLKGVRITPDVDGSAVRFTVSASGEPDGDRKIMILDGDRTVAEAEWENGKEKIVPMENPVLWSPENPHLYDVVLTCGEDMVHTYFGMRKFSCGRDGNGVLRLFLNNRPYFHNGLLDQGYWSDGMLTPPSDEAMEYDVKLAKSMGFNMLRKHIKVEPMRWYYHCDRLGIIVWQDMPSGGGKYSFLCIGALPFVHINLPDDMYGFFARRDLTGRKEFEEQYAEMMDNLYNCVSVGMWVPFNEGWGQFDSRRVSALTKKKDPTRTVDSASGWHDQGEDMKSIHCYFRPFIMPFSRKRPVLLTEFGGYSHKVEGHVFSRKVFGYKVFRTKEAFGDAYEKLFRKQIIPAVPKGLAAAVYTQLSDVETEINGLVTYDRRIVKIDPERVKRINEGLRV